MGNKDESVPVRIRQSLFMAVSAEQHQRRLAAGKKVPVADLLEEAWERSYNVNLGNTHTLSDKQWSEVIRSLHTLSQLVASLTEYLEGLAGEPVDAPIRHAVREGKEKFQRSLDEAGRRLGRAERMLARATGDDAGTAADPERDTQRAENE